MFAKRKINTVIKINPSTKYKKEMMKFTLR